MKIYFAASIMGGREDVHIYSEIISFLKNYGEVLTEHIGHPDIGESGEQDKSFVHDRDLKWLLSSDVVIAEVSTPSLGVGYELGRAVEQGKRILCIYRKNSPRGLSGMISGNKSMEVHTYETIDDSKRIIKWFFEKK